MFVLTEFHNVPLGLIFMSSPWMSDLLLSASDVQMRACYCFFLVLTKGVREGRFQGRCWSCSSYFPTSRSSITCWSLSSGPDEPASFPPVWLSIHADCNTQILIQRSFILVVDEKQCLKISVYRYTTLFVHTV